MTVVMKSVLSLVLVISCAGAADLTFPDYIKTCSKKDSNLSNCLKDTLEKMQPYQGKGLPAPDGRLLGQYLEPFKIQKLSIVQGSGPVIINAHFKNLIIHGISNATIKSMKFDMDNWQFDITFTYPEFRITGDYSVDGNILLLPVTGEGDGSGLTRDITVFTKTFGHLEERNGRKYMKVDRTEFDFKIGKFMIHFNKLFNGNKLLGDTMNRFINENYEEIIDALRETSSGEFNKIWNGMITQILDNIPVDVFISDM